MDETVLRALAKWPNVPSVYGWLSLDRRGQWLIKGERIANPLVSAFINRNYESDLEGRWYFQNGPQRVYVRLEYTPYVHMVERRDDDLALATHTGLPATQVREALLDETGALVLRTDVGVGVVSDRDLATLAELLVTEAGEPADEASLAALASGAPAPRLHLMYGPRRVLISLATSHDLPGRFAYQLEPRPAPGEPEC
jgi:hypothetical protein